jgi:long-chain acyl-CoA synthetase
MTEIASYRQAFMIVALYDTLGAEAMEYIINQTSMEYIVLSADKLDNIIRLKSQIATISTAIVMDDEVDDAKKAEAEAAGIKVYTFRQVETIGSEVTSESDLPKPEDIATICYTRYTVREKDYIIDQLSNIT